jgi:putative nucleotidyltransferase with HDIG domain
MTDGLEETGTRVRLSEVLSALSFILDRVEGQPEGHAVRSCFIGMSVAERLGLSEERRSALFYALLLKDAGCSSNASRVAALLDADDSGAKSALKMVDRDRLPEAVAYLVRNVGRGRPLRSRVGRFFSVLLRGQKEGREFVRIRCERGAEISRSLGFPEGTARAIRALDERWDGAGHPDGLRGEEIPLLARICGLAQTIEVFHAAGGPARAEGVARDRRGTWFAPEVVDAFLAAAREDDLWERLRGPGLATSVSGMEPGEEIPATPERLDRIPRAFARIIDAKSPFTYRHSEGVATAAAAMGERMGFAPRAVRDQEWAGLLHDIGKLSVSSRILDKPGPLTAAERTEIRKHPALTYDILSRVTPFRHLAEVAASHHERPDGKGYHRGLKADALSLRARILAVADTFDALSQDRPYRPAMPMEKVLDCLRNESGTGLCPECVEVLEDLVSDGEGCLALGRSAPKVGRDSMTRYP